MQILDAVNSNWVHNQATPGVPGPLRIAVQHETRKTFLIDHVLGRLERTISQVVETKSWGCFGAAAPLTPGGAEKLCLPPGTQRALVFLGYRPEDAVGLRAHWELVACLRAAVLEFGPIVRLSVVRFAGGEWSEDADFGREFMSLWAPAPGQ